MNEDVTKTIIQTIDGFQWILIATLGGLIVYFIFTSKKKKK